MHHCDINDSDDNDSDNNDSYKKTMNHTYNSKTIMLVCEGCDKKFTEKHNYICHVNTCNSINYKYKCEICERKFKKKYNYTIHINRKTKCQKIQYKYDLNCPCCNKKFTKKSSVTTHLKICNKISDVNKIVSYDSIKTSIFKKLSSYHYHIYMCGYDSVLELIKIIYFNATYPEHKNIYMSNINGNYVKVFVNDQWEYRDKKNFIEELYGRWQKCLECNYESFYELHEEEIPLRISENLTRMFKFDYNDKNPYYTKSIREIKILLRNNNNVVDNN